MTEMPTPIIDDALLHTWAVWFRNNRLHHTLGLSLIAFLQAPAPIAHVLREVMHVSRPPVDVPVLDMRTRYQVAAILNDEASYG